MTVSQNDGDVYYCDPGAIEVSRQGADCLPSPSPIYTRYCSLIAFSWMPGRRGCKHRNRSGHRSCPCSHFSCGRRSS